jgi:tetratricopeptide (TPR) repeat protein
MRIALDLSNAGFDALNALLEGLEKTGRRSVWGFSNWPLSDITPKTAGTVLFNGKQNFSCKIDVSLLNEKNKTIGKNSITLNTAIVNFSGNNLTKPLSVYGTVNFSNIKAEDLTPVLTIVIDAVNGIKAQNLNVTGYMKIETGDLEKGIAEWQAAAERAEHERQATVERERQAAAEKTERERIVAVKTYLDQGMKYYNLNDYKKAIAEFTQVIRLDPNNAIAYYWRGFSYRHMKDYKKAIADYTEAIRINPNDSNAYNNRGVAYNEKKDYKKAIADYTEAIRLNPNNANAYSNRGISYHWLRDYTKAIADYTVALRFEPNNIEWKQNLENARKARGW